LTSVVFLYAVSFSVAMSEAKEGREPSHGGDVASPSSLQFDALSLLNLPVIFPVEEDGLGRRSSIAATKKG